MNDDRLIEPKGTSDIDPDAAKKQLATYMLLGQMMRRQEVEEGRRAPDEPQLQLSGKGWQIWGGSFEEPIPFTVTEVYLRLLDAHGAEEAQRVLDMTRQRCGELRLAAKRAKGKQAKEIEGHWEKLRNELTEAQELKKEKGISSIQ